MCTSLSLQNNYFGRNLDLDADFNSQIILCPRNYNLKFKKLPPQKHHFALLGTATKALDQPLYAEAINEKGLYMAGLYFPIYAHYEKDAPSAKIQAAPYELIPLTLGRCQNLKEAAQLLQNICLMDIPFSPDLPLVPLHWHIADKSGAIVFEQTKNGASIHHDPIGVLTNSPPFCFHQHALLAYQNLSPNQPQNHNFPELTLTNYGLGLGALGLPGDWSPISRYVKTAFIKVNSPNQTQTSAAVSQFFHILDAVAMPYGSVIGDNGQKDHTLYSCCFDAALGACYYKSYSNNQLSVINFFQENLDADTLKIFNLPQEQNLHHLN